jgi:hypothetical protein
MLMASLQTQAADAANGDASTGQSLPTGASAPTQASASALAPAAPSGQFVESALAFLTSLQDPRSAAIAVGQATASIAVQRGASALSSALDALTKALNGSAASASSASGQLSSLASTASAAASSLSAGTGSSMFKALDQLSAALGLGAHPYAQPAAAGAGQGLAGLAGLLV